MLVRSNKCRDGECDVDDVAGETGGWQAQVSVTPLTLRDVANALDTAVAQLVEAPNGDQVTVSSAALVDSADLAGEEQAPRPPTAIYVLIGVSARETLAWLAAVSERTADQRPAAVMTKEADDAVRSAAYGAGVAVIAVPHQARWDHLFPLVQRVLGRTRRPLGGGFDDADLLQPDIDLFDLAQAVAVNAGGMVTIEDVHSKVLAYSASDASADELRTLSIMGREGPQEYLRVLRLWGVFDRLRETDDVVEVPGHPELGIHPRLVVSIRRDSAAPSRELMLGSIWLQQGASELHSGAADVLRGASAVAARLISRALNAPSTEGLLIQRLFGVDGGGVDIPTISAALHIDPRGPAAVLGFALPSAGGAHGTDVSVIGSTLRLHASSFRRDAIATIIGARAYVLLPQYKSASGVTTWARHLVHQLETQQGLMLRAAIALPLADLSHVATARGEVDRVLDATAVTAATDRVTTLAESLTPVLLGEILELIASRADLTDPRLTALDDYDRDHDGWLRASVTAYLEASGDVRRAASAVNVHPNTLRYRLRRVEEILGVDLADRADRILLDVQLAAAQHRQRHTPHRIVR